MAIKRKTRKKPTQESFANIKFQGPLEFGGSHLKKSHAKGERPFCSKSSIHVVMKSSQAKGAMNLLHFDKKIRSRVRQQALRWNVKVYSFANAGNHIHLLIRAYHRIGFLGFLRGVASLVARAVLGVERGSGGSELAGSFWDQRPFSRIVRSWTGDFQNVKAYLCLNRLEGQGWVQAGLSSPQRRKLCAWLRLQLWPA